MTDAEKARLRELLNSSRRIVIFCHSNPDGDALGSTLAWAEYLRQQGKDATVVAPDQFPDFLHWMPGCNAVIRFDKKRDAVKELIDGADLLCFMDLNTISRTGEALSSLLSAVDKPSLLIDHHIDPAIKATVSISFPLMSSTAELIFRLVWQLGGYEAMTKNMAVNLYCGMMTDTGGFTFNSSRPEIFFIIAQLIAKGIDKDRIYRNIYHVYSIDRLRLTGYILYQKMKVLTPLRASYYIITKEEQRRFHFIKGDAEGLVNMPLQIKGHRLSISLREDTEKANLVWISLRSVDDFPCNEMAARFFNGGGHKNASGGKLFCSLPEAEAVTRKAIQAYSARL